MRKIAIITGTRAEYGLLYWTMRELQERGAELQLIVTGAHLSPDHGMTVKQIEADGWIVAAKVDMKLSSDQPLQLARSMGTGLSGIAEALDRLKPDIAVILGDRYEMLAVASAAAILHIPIAHIHGGEETEGAQDNAWRHAITKLSYWHFPPYEKARQRIVQMGENPAHVFTVGAPGIDNIAKLPLLSKSDLEKEFGISLISPVLLLTYHPEELSGIPVEQQIHMVLAALEAFPDATLLITGANADTGGRVINTILQSFAAKRPRTFFRMSYGSLLYLSAIKHCDVVVGNSSSAMLEAPTLGKTTVNIGDRQKGRLRLPSIIDCACDKEAITQAIRLALSPEFQKNTKPSNPFGTPGEVAGNIAQKLLSLKTDSLRKEFHEV